MPESPGDCDAFRHQSVAIPAAATRIRRCGTTPDALPEDGTEPRADTTKTACDDDNAERS
jgi:hypothetical protein